MSSDAYATNGFGAAPGFIDARLIRTASVLNGCTMHQPITPPMPDVAKITGFESGVGGGGLSSGREMPLGACMAAQPLRGRARANSAPPRRNSEATSAARRSR